MRTIWLNDLIDLKGSYRGNHFMVYSSTQLKTSYLFNKETAESNQPFFCEEISEFNYSSWI